MNKLLLSIAAGIVALALGAAEAAPVCTPLEPREWSGTLLAPTASGWVTTTAFEKTNTAGLPEKCKWNGLEALNGFDAFVWEVKTHVGLPATIEVSNPNPPGFAAGTSYFLSADCRRIGIFGLSTDTPTTVGIPQEAEWVVVLGSAGPTGFAVKMVAAGVTCSTPTKQKKKKKKRSRG